MLELNRLILFRLSLALHLAVGVVLAAAPAFAKQWPMFERLQFLSSAVGWREVGDAVHARLGQDRYGAIVVDTRELAAELLYYLRDVSTPLYVRPSGPLPSHHYELTRPFTASTPEPILYVSLRRCPDRFRDRFATVDGLGTQSVPVVKHEARVLHFCRLAGYRPSAASNAP